MRAPKHAVSQTRRSARPCSIGQAMYTQYLLPVEIVGVLLLMALIGGVILVRRLGPAAA